MARLTAGEINNRGGTASHARFVGVDRVIADHPAFLEAPLIEKMLYFDLRRQKNRSANGNICATMSVMEPLGWSRKTLYKALRGLLKRGLIKVTRKGGVASMSKIVQLYAFTHEHVIEDKGRGIRGGQATDEYKLYQSTPKTKYTRAKPKPKVERASRALIRASSALSKGHLVPTEPIERASSALCNSIEIRTQVHEAQSN